MSVGQRALKITKRSHHCDAMGLMLVCFVSSENIAEWAEATAEKQNEKNVQEADDKRPLHSYRCELRLKPSNIRSQKSMPFNRF